MEDVLFEQNDEKEEVKNENGVGVAPSCNHESIIEEVIKLREKLSIQNEHLEKEIEQMSQIDDLKSAL